MDNSAQNPYPAKGTSEDASPMAHEFAGVADPESSQAVGSILVADCGSSYTRVSLLEQAETGYCFVAHATMPTTAEPPWSDVSAGARHAIEQIVEVIGRPLLDETGNLILPQTGNAGVDLFVLTASAGQPLRVVLAGLVSRISLASLERAAESAYVQVVGIIARDRIGIPHGNRSVKSYGPSPSSVPLTAERLRLYGLSAPAGPKDAGPSNDSSQSSNTGLSDEDKISLVRRQHPDVVWVTGGTDGGSRDPVRDLVETVALACTLVDAPPQPAMVYAGNAELRSEIVDLIGEEVEIEVIDNVRPALDVENLAMAQATFQSEYVRRKLQRVPGIGTLIGWSSAPLLSTAQALEYLVLYLERLYESGKGVLCADVGSAAATIAASFPQRLESSSPTPMAGNQSSLQIITDLGVGYGAPTLLERVGVKAIARWLPFEPEPGQVQAVLLNKSVRATTLPQERQQLLIEQAAAREALRLVMAQARESWRHSSRQDGFRGPLTPPLEPIVASGGVLGNAPRPGQAALMLLDAIEPVGISTLVLDKSGIAAALGAIAVTQPQAAVQALDAGAFMPLGTVVAPVGRARPGEVIMSVKITFEPFPSSGETKTGGELEVEVKYGSLEVLPLRTGEKAQLEFKLRRGISLGRVGKAVEVNGGEVGLIIDARGRPLRLPSNPSACRQHMQQWIWDMGT